MQSYFSICVVHIGIELNEIHEIPVEIKQAVALHVGCQIALKESLPFRVFAITVQFRQFKFNHAYKGTWVEMAP